MSENFAFHRQEVIGRRVQQIAQQVPQAPVIQPQQALYEPPMYSLSDEEIERLRSILKLMDNLKWMFSTLRLWFIYVLAGLGGLVAFWDTIEKLLKKISLL